MRGFEKAVWYRTVRWRLHERSAYPHYGNRNRTDRTRQQLVIAARAAGVQCFDTVYTDLENEDGFREDVNTIHLMGFDGKSIINPRQIHIVHEIFTPKEKEIIFAEKVVREIDSKKAQESVYLLWTER